MRFRGLSISVRTREGMLRVAKETITKLIDDLDRREAHESVKFGLDGHSYEIDLSKAIRNCWCTSFGTAQETVTLVVADLGGAPVGKPDDHLARPVAAPGASGTLRRRHQAQRPS
jgi:hypothetical protein